MKSAYVPYHVAHPLGVWKVMGSMLGLKFFIAKDGTIFDAHE